MTLCSNSLTSPLLWVMNQSVGPLKRVNISKRQNQIYITLCMYFFEGKCKVVSHQTRSVKESMLNVSFSCCSQNKKHHIRFTHLISGFEVLRGEFCSTHLVSRQLSTTCRVLRALEISHFEQVKKVQSPSELMAIFDDEFDKRGAVSFLFNPPGGLM